MKGVSHDQALKLYYRPMLFLAYVGVLLLSLVKTQFTATEVVALSAMLILAVVVVIVAFRREEWSEAGIVLRGRYIAHIATIAGTVALFMLLRQIRLSSTSSAVVLLASSLSVYLIVTFTVEKTESIHVVRRPLLYIALVFFNFVAITLRKINTTAITWSGFRPGARPRMRK